MIYLFCTFFSIVTAILYNHADTGKGYKYRTAQFILGVIISVPLTVISSMRYDVGTDYLKYRELFSSYQTSVNASYPLFSILNNVLRFFSSNPEVFFIVTSIFICGTVFFSIFKYSINPAFSIFLFVFSRNYFRSMNGIRQFIAAAIILYAIDSIKERNFKRFIIIVVLAMGFHPTAMVVIPLYFLYDVKINLKKAIEASIVLVLAGRAIVHYLIPIIGRYSKYVRYFDSESIFSNVVVSRTSIAIALGVFIVSYYVSTKRDTTTSDNRIVLASSFYALLLTLSTLFMPRNFIRMHWYLDIIICVFLPNTIRLIKPEKLRLLVNVLVVACYVYILMSNVYGRNEQEVLPYQTFLDVLI